MFYGIILIINPNKQTLLKSMQYELQHDLTGFPIVGGMIFFEPSPYQIWCPPLGVPHSKLVSAIFYQFFIFHQMIALQKLWKMFFISSKKLFSFLRYLNFCIFVFPSFFTLSVIALEVDPRKILKFMMSSTV